EGDTTDVRGILQARQIVPTPDQLGLLFDDQVREAFRVAGLRSAREILAQGVVDAARTVDLTAGSVTLRRGEREEAAEPSTIMTSRDFFARAVALLPDAFAPDARDLFR